MSRIFLLCSACLLLCSCGQKSLEVAVPPVEWTEPAPEPKVPAPERLCDPNQREGVIEMCWTDAQVAEYLTKLIQWGRENTDKLLRLRDWRAGVTD